MLTVISIASVVAVYAVFLNEYTSTGEVTVGGVAESFVTYSNDNVEAGSWGGDLVLTGSSDDWYCRLEIPANSYSGPVIITWKLQEKTGTGANDWADVTGVTFPTTSIVLDGNAADVYATTDGAYAASNHNWNADDFAGTFRVLAYIESS